MAVRTYTFGEKKTPVPGLTRELFDYLAEGFRRIDGKLPLFDDEGDWFSPETIDFAVNEGWVEPAYENQIMKASKIMRLTEEGREIFEATSTC